MAKSSYHIETLVFVCAFLSSVTCGQHPNHLPQTKDDTNLRLESETLKTRFESIEIQFDRLREEVRLLKTKASEKDLHNTGDVASSKGGIPRSCHEARLADPSLSTGVYWIDPATAKVLETIPSSKLRHVFRNDNHWARHRSIDKRRPLHRSRLLYETNRVPSMCCSSEIY